MKRRPRPSIKPYAGQLRTSRKKDGLLRKMTRTLDLHWYPTHCTTSSHLHSYKNSHKSSISHEKRSRTNFGQFSRTAKYHKDWTKHTSNKWRKKVLPSPFFTMPKLRKEKVSGRTVTAQHPYCFNKVESDLNNILNKFFHRILTITKISKQAARQFESTLFHWKGTCSLTAP